MSGLKSREGDLDLWRGLCLANVVLVHLAYNGIGFPEPLDTAIKHYTRFAAGGFVFLAGLSIAVIFGRRIDGTSAQRRDVYRWCLRRGAMLLAVDTCAAAAFRIVDLVRAFPSDVDSPLAVALSELFALQRPGITGGILQFYAVMFVVWPAVFELRRRAGRVAVLVASLSLYAAAVTLAGVFLWPPFEFPVAYWQVLFTLGFVSDHLYRRRAAGGLALHLAWVGVAAIAYAAVFLDLHGPEFGVHTLNDWSPLDYRKTPLQPGAAVWYLATINVVLSLSSLFLALGVGAKSTWLLQLLGRHSLAVYVAHVFTEALAMEYVWSIWPPAPVRLAVALLDLAALVGLCWVFESGWLATMRSRAAVWLAGLGMTPQPAWARAAVSFLAVAWISTFIGMRQPDRALELAEPAAESPVDELVEVVSESGLELDGAVVETAVEGEGDTDGRMTPLDALSPDEFAAFDEGTAPSDGNFVEDPTSLPDEAQLLGPI